VEIVNHIKVDLKRVAICTYNKVILVVRSTLGWSWK